MNTRRPQHNPCFLRVGALTLAIVLVLGGSAALAWFLAGRGRDGDTSTAQTAGHPAEQDSSRQSHALDKLFPADQRRKAANCYGITGRRHR